MLKGIDPNLSPELVYTLLQMGHGDEIAIVDSNFPAYATAYATQTGNIIDVPGLDAPALMTSLIAHFPLDSFTKSCAWRMEIDNAPDEMGAVHNEVFAVLGQARPQKSTLSSLERQVFYQRARQCFAVVRTGEKRPYGCFILRKGVIF